MIKDYVKSQAFLLVFDTFFVLALAFLLRMLYLPLSLVLLVSGLFAAVLLLNVFHTAARKIAYYQTMQQHLDVLDRSYLLADILDEPFFWDGRILYDTLKICNRAMNDEINQYQLSQKAYREYVETWVHEVKNPIAAAKLIVENRQSVDRESLLEELFLIEQHVEQALYYAKTNTPIKDYQIQKLSLQSVVQNALKNHAVLLIAKQFHIDISPLAADIYSDSKWLAFILGQLLSNAIKYSKEAPSLHFHETIDAQSVTLYMQDAGIGIPVQDLNRIYEKGYTGENGHRFPKSTGMGLYLCKEMCCSLSIGIRIYNTNSCGIMIELQFPIGTHNLTKS